MLTSSRILPAVLVDETKVIDRLVLPHQERHKRKFVFTTASGKDFLLDLEKAVHLRHGDACVLNDGTMIIVEAAVEDCLEVSSQNPARLLRLAWHIGNRHTPAEITAEAIYIEDDHVLAEMVRGLGAEVKKVQRRFQPEQGAYHQH